MKTREFINVLNGQAKKALIFEYLPGKRVGANYHITEIKNTSIEAVNCGGSADSWNETMVQLWENPGEKNKKDYLTTSKALSIIHKVHAIKPMDMDAVIRFEFGNENFHTAQLFVNETQTNENALLVTLGIQQTACKAEELCGVLENNIQEVAGCCSPNSGCC